MASGYRSGGVDFDDLFDPYVSGTKPALTGRRVGGVDLRDRYAPLSLGSKRANVGHRVGGVDVSNLWAAKGTASYVSDGGLPSELNARVIVPPNTPATVAAEFSYSTSGSVSWSTGSDSGSGTWTSAAPASSYDIRFDETGSSGDGSLSGAARGQWLQVNAARGLSLSAFGTPNVYASKAFRIRIRRRSDGQVLVDRSLFISANIEGI